MRPPSGSGNGIVRRFYKHATPTGSTGEYFNRTLVIVNCQLNCNTC